MTFLESLLAQINQESLEAVIVGNAAGALQGAPVTTLDVAFMIRDTPANMEKLKRIAIAKEAVMNRPFEPASRMIRLLGHDFQADFLVQMDGVKSFESLRARAEVMKIGSKEAWVASLEDVVKSKKAANREKDLASLPLLEKTLMVKNALKIRG